MWNAAALFGFVVLTMLGLRAGVRYSLWAEADSQMVEDANEARLVVEQFYPDIPEIARELNRKALTHTHRGFFARIFVDGRLTWSSERAPPDIYPISSERNFGRPENNGPYRVVHIRPRLPALNHLTIRVGTSFRPFEDSVTQFTRVMMMAGGVVLLLCPLGGYWLAGRATRPLTQIINTTSRLRPSHLGQRLEIRGTGDELDRLSVTINGFLDRIAAYIQQNKEFTANAAHELRSPLTAMQTSLEVALSTDRKPEEYREILTEVLGISESLATLFNHLLLLAESDAGRMNFDRESCHLARLVKKSVAMFSGVAEAADITLSENISGEGLVHGNARALQQLVNNLIDNALKFTPAGGAVEVAFHETAAECELLVRDNGQGIPDADLPHLFERFFRGDKSHNRGTRGSGLGLSICHSVVEAHHGSILIEPSPGGGTTVRVRLPGHVASPARHSVATHG